MYKDKLGKKTPSRTVEYKDDGQENKLKSRTEHRYYISNLLTFSAKRKQ